MKNILIFKTDRIGDLVNISPILNNLNKNFPDSKISIVCSDYNSSIAKYYNFLNKIFILKGSFLFFLLKNFKYFFFIKYDLILQLDGKSHSYNSSFFIRSKVKVAIKFIKSKKILGLVFSISRPNIIVSSAFSFFQNTIEDYNIKNNKSYHYLSLYLKLLERLNITIYSKDHYLPYSSKNFDYHKLPKSYYLFHIDERWTFFDDNVFLNLEKKILTISKSENIVITSNFNENFLFNRLIKKFNFSSNIYFKKNVSVDDLIHFIYKSHTVVSSHTGFIVHVAAAFKKKIVDIVPLKKFNELDRWIPFRANYLRLNLNNFLNIKF